MSQPTTLTRAETPAPAAVPAAAPAAVATLVAYGCDPDEAALLRDLADRFGARVTAVEEPLTAASAGLARGGACVSVSHKTPVTRAAVDALAAAGVTHLTTRSVGSDHLDVEHARSLGIAVEAVGYDPDGVADFTVMLILLALRGTRDVLRRGERFDFRLPEARGRDLRDLTVGVVGAGRIGSAVIRRLRGFGCRLVVHDDAGTPGGAAHGSVPLTTLLAQSDVVTLHTPLTDRTRHLLDADRLALLPRGAVVVNTGRGGLIDTAALLAALEDGHLGGAALDVVEGEGGVFYTDLPATSGAPSDARPDAVSGAGVPETLRRLHALPQVVVTPHTAYYTAGALRDTVTRTLAACREHVALARAA